LLSLFLPSACIIWLLIGIPCPACGLTRAFLALAGLNFAQAFAMHPLFWAVPFVPLMAHRKLSEKSRNVLAFSFLGVFLAVYAVRMVLLFPETAPMVMNENAWLRFWR
jgi:hypothetical protein